MEGPEIVAAESALSQNRLMNNHASGSPNSVATGERRGQRPYPSVPAWCAAFLERKAAAARSVALSDQRSQQVFSWARGGRLPAPDVHEPACLFSAVVHRRLRHLACRQHVRME